MPSRIAAALRNPAHLVPKDEAMALLWECRGQVVLADLLKELSVGMSEAAVQWTRWALQARFDPRQPDDEGRTALMRSLWFPSALQLILAKDATPTLLNATTPDGQTALHLACQDRNTLGVAVNLLAQAGASVDVKDQWGATPLLYSGHSGAKTRTLLQHGADPLAQDKQRNSVLHRWLSEHGMADEQALAALAPLLPQSEWLRPNKALMSPIDLLGKERHSSYAQAFLEVCPDAVVLQMHTHWDRPRPKPYVQIMAHDPDWQPELGQRIARAHQAQLEQALSAAPTSQRKVRL